jgi:hypothetical protein
MVSLIRNIILAVLLIITITTCQDKVFTGDVNCDDCDIDKPDLIYITLNVTINDEFPEVPVLLYKGRSIENGELVDTFYCYAEDGIIYNQASVEADEEYSAKAIYETEERTVYVVDGIKQKLKRVTDACEEECWVSENDELQLELAY